MKHCPGCDTEKSREDFHTHAKRSDGLQVYCKLCKSKRSRASFKKHPEKAVLQAKRNKYNRAANREYVSRYKSAKGCMFCGENHPIALDLHHLNPAMKDSAVSAMLYNCKARIDVEIQKCVVLCANCHRKHHAGVDGYEINC